jgi:hypothetical protein
MERIRGVAPVAEAPSGPEVMSGADLQAGTVTGTIVRETVPAVLDYDTDWEAGTTTTIVVSPPVYEPVMATVTAYGPGRRGHAATAVASVVNGMDGSFRLDVPVDRVYLRVAPTSSDWQAGWLWVKHMVTCGPGFLGPGFASYLQFRPPDVFDVIPPANLKMLSVIPAFAHGRVLDVATAAPVVGARVSYIPVGKGHKTVKGVADASGEYRLDGLDYEEYHIRVTAPGYFGGYLGGSDNTVFRTSPEAHTWGPGPLDDGGVINMARR